MNDAQVGSVIRAIRTRRRLTQAEVALAAGVGRTIVSQVECGRFETTSLSSIRRVAAALGVSLPLAPAWRGAEMAKLLDEEHARIVLQATRRLTGLGWTVRPEHSFNIWGERGCLDLLGWQPESRAVLVVEVKTRLPDLQDLLGTMDRKRRLAPSIARELGWQSKAVASILVLPEATWARNAVARFGPVFHAALPSRSADVRRWLREPEKDLRGIWFLVNDAPGGTARRPAGLLRVRRPRDGSSARPPRSGGTIAAAE
jgi:transcriptional regulator with XRE-family HTH domain